MENIHVAALKQKFVDEFGETMPRKYSQALYSVSTSLYS